MTGKGTGRKSPLCHILNISDFSLRIFIQYGKCIKNSGEDFYYKKEQQLLSFTAQNYY